MFKHLKIVFVSLLIIIIFISVTCCSEVNNIIQFNNNENTIITIDNIIDDDIENDKIYQDIQYSVVNCSGNDLLAKSLDELNDETKKQAEQFKEENKQSIRDYIENFNNQEAMYEYSSTIEISKQDNRYLSLRNMVYIFTMGAHGNYVVNGYTYDIKTGKKLTLDFFIKDKEELRKYIKNWIANQEEDMFFDEADEVVDKYIDGQYELQFILYDDNFSVIFQPYDIAAYAVGLIEIDIDKKLLKNY